MLPSPMHHHGWTCHLNISLFISLLFCFTVAALFGFSIFLTSNCHSPVSFPYTHIYKSYYSIQYNVQILNLLLFWLNWHFFFFLKNVFTELVSSSWWNVQCIYLLFTLCILPYFLEMNSVLITKTTSSLKN